MASGDLFESELIKLILSSGLEDWIDPGLIYYFTKYLGAEPIDRDLMVIGAIVRLVESGLMVPGQTRDGGFAPWPGGVDDWVARLVRYLAAFEGMLGPGDVAWLQNTPLGDEMATAHRLSE